MSLEQCSVPVGLDHKSSLCFHIKIIINSVLPPASLYITFSAAIHNKAFYIPFKSASIVSLLKGLPAARMSTVFKLDVASLDNSYKNVVSRGSYLSSLSSHQACSN